MTDHHTAERLRSAYRLAEAALGELRAALVEAGVLEATSSPAELPTESPEARRRRLKTERQRRWRERLAVDAGASTQPPTGASTERLQVDAAPSTAPSTERLPSVYEASTSDASDPRARARSLLEKEVNTPSLFSLTLEQLTTPNGSESPVETTLPAPTRSTRRKAPARERPSLASGSTIDTSDGSPAVPASDRASESKGGGPGSADVARVWSVYAETLGSTRVRLTTPRAELIRRRLRDYTVEELERSIRGYGRSAFHRGENDRGRPYQTIELWLRDAAHVEAGWSYLEAKPSASRSTKKSAPELDGISRDWQEYEARLEADRDVFAET